MLRSLENVQTNSSATTAIKDSTKDVDYNRNINLSKNEQEAFDIFVINYQNRDELQYYYDGLDSKYKAAKNEADKIQNCKEDIIKLKNCFDSISDYNYETKIALSQKLTTMQALYRASLMSLETNKKDIEFLKQGLNQAQMKLIENFKSWYNKDEGIIKEGGDNIMNASCTNYNIQNPQIYQMHQTIQYANVPKNNLFTIQTPNALSYNLQAKEFPGMSNVSNEPKSPPSMLPLNLNKTNYASNLKTFCGNSSPNTNLYETNNYALNKENSNCLNTNQNLNQMQYNTNQTYTLKSDYIDQQQCQINSVLSTATNQTVSNTCPLMPGMNCVSNAEDTEEFKEFMKTIRSTGDPEIDDEIRQFYRNKFKRTL